MVLLSNMPVLSFMLMLSFMHNALSLFYVIVFGFGIMPLLLRFSSPVPCRILGKLLSLSENSFLFLKLS